MNEPAINGVDVVIPIYGSWNLTRECLLHLQAQTYQPKIFVVDNASPDDSVNRIRAEFPEVELITLDENSGFAVACNRGVRSGSGEIVVLLNNDVNCEVTFIENIVKGFDSPEIGSLAPLLLRPGGDSLDSLGITVDPTLAGFIRCQSWHPDQIEQPRPPLLGPFGAAAAYRRSAWEQVEGLDERIFMYGEELDLALKLSAAGYLSAECPAAVGTHLGGATAIKASAWQRDLGGFGRAYLLRRYGVLSTRYAVRAFVTEAIVVVADAVISRDLAALRGRVRGWRAGKGLPKRQHPTHGVDPKITFRRSLKMRRGDYENG